MKCKKVLVPLVIIFTTAIVLLMLNSQPSSSKTVGLQPFGAFPKTQIDSVQSALQKQYGVQVYVLPQQKLPKSAFVNLKSPRYRADSLLKHLKTNKPDSIDYVIGLTAKDISTTKRDKLGRVKKPVSRYQDWGIFGLGYRPGAASVVSTYRLNKPGMTIERLQKVAVHELGHNLGLKHCTTNQNCVMDDAAESIKTVDAGHITLCQRCKDRVK